MINERDSIVMTARQRWLSEQDLSVPLKDNTGNIIGSVDKASGESSCVFTVVEPAAVASLRQACEGENLRYVSMGYRVKEVDPERIAFEDWYTCNAFNLEESPLGSRDCCLMWKAWQARASIANDNNT